MRTRIVRPLVVGGLMLSMVSVMPGAPRIEAKGSGGSVPVCPTFSASNFHHPTTINNPYSPLVPGTRFTYKGNAKKQAEVNTVYVTHNTPTIDGISAVEVRDQVFNSGVLSEETLDWYAQDDQGNVWYMGELSTDVTTGSQTGSWTAGVNGAQPGYTMEASPKVGDNYCQENAPGVAQDAAQVVSLTASRSVPFGSYTGDVLQTKEYSLIEPHTEYKYYEPSVGMLEAIALSGGSEDIQLYTIESHV